MPRFPAILLMVAAVAVTSGCGGSNPKEQMTARSETANGAEADRHAIRLRTKNELDELRHEAQEAMHQVGASFKKKVNTHTDELSAFAAEMAEAAKDRAEDIPEAIDRALERHTRRYRDASWNVRREVDSQR